ncbi:hypothetical protein BDR04DRAFT_782544 [Suillus decipiens]|nr:hypothetical protein BDR04DRAFT_782544 [Suillus decipiens]
MSYWSTKRTWFYSLIVLHLHHSLLQSDATPRSVRRNPVITPVMSSIPRHLPTRDSYTFRHFLHKLLPSSSHTDVARTDEPRNLLVPCYISPTSSTYKT